VANKRNKWYSYFPISKKELIYDELAAFYLVGSV